VLVLGEVAGLQNGDRWFTPGDAARLFEALRLPPPGNVSQSLKRLEDRGHVRRRSGGGWSLTPLGRTAAIKLVGDIEPDRLDAELHPQEGAELGHAVHATIPPTLAPQRWVSAISAMLDRYPFDRNVFCMTRFPGEPTSGDPLAGTIEVVRSALQRHDLVVHLASDRNLDDDLWGNVAAHMWACHYGVALFEDRGGAGINENLLAEVGAMLATGRRCALMKDKTIPRLPTDFVGQIYKDVDFSDRNSVRDEIHRWAAVDLGLGHCPDCP
jgi:hypothetical protein